MAKASNMELRKSVLEGEIRIHTVLKEEIRSPKHQLLFTDFFETEDKTLPLTCQS